MTPMNPERDFRDHLRTYRGFVRGISWTVAGFAAVLIVLAIWLL
ncbi:aa3-type cytochrome c oxidase subunit IV [Hyphomicrobium sp.]